MSLLLVEHTATAVRRRAMVALFAGVAFINIAMVGASTVSTLIASESTGPGWSGVPGAAGVLGTALGALSSGAVMARRGRRFGLLAAYGLAVAGGVLAFAGAVAGTLPVLLAGMIMLGLGNGGAQLARYAAAELYPEERRGFGLSTIVWGGTIGAVVGPALISPAARAADAVRLPELSGPIAVSTLVLAAAVLTTVAMPRVSALAGGARRPGAVRLSLGAALRLPAVARPLAAMVAAQGAMVAVMTMTPLQLHQHGHGLDVVGWVLSAHLIGMFALAPLSGRIADRWGGRAAIWGGLGTLALSATVVVSSPTAHDSGIPVALFLLGYGWNLVFVGGSSMLSRELPEDERTRLQGLVDALVWGSAALASLSAGLLFGFGGYSLVAVFAGALLMLPVTLLGRRGPRPT